LTSHDVRLAIFNAEAGPARPAVLGGREYLVTPIASINPGVLNGSKGALLYLPEDCAANVGGWDAVPLTHGHPIRDGFHVSAGESGVLDNQGMGFVRKSRFADGKLRHEGWFDVERTARIDSGLPPSERILPRLRSGRPIEVSTGLYTDNEKAPEGSTWKGRGYDYVARNYRPDHIAVLSSEVGACSVNDGCGIGVNQRMARTPDGLTVNVDNQFPISPPVGQGRGSEEDYSEEENPRARGHTSNELDGQGGEMPAVSTTALRSVDFVTLPRGVEGTNCGNCSFQHKGVCVHPEIRGQPVTDRNCCSCWDAAGTLRRWKEVTRMTDAVGNAGPFQSRDDAGQFGSGIDKDALEAEAGRRGMDVDELKEQLGIAEPKGGKGGGKKATKNAKAAGVKMPKGTVSGKGSSGQGSGNAPKMPKAAEAGSAEAATRLQQAGDVASGTANDGEGGGSEQSGPSRAGKGVRKAVDPALLEVAADNAAPNQPRHMESGRYLPHGAGIGKGPVHLSAKDGHADLTLNPEDRTLGVDAKAQANRGANPPSWAVDEDKWERAKAAADKGDYSGDTYWAVVSHIYQDMGGSIKGKTKNMATRNANPESQLYDPSAGNRSGPRQQTDDGRTNKKVVRTDPIDTVDGDGDPEEDMDSHGVEDTEEYAARISDKTTTGGLGVANVWSDAAREAAIEARHASQAAHNLTTGIKNPGQAGLASTAAREGGVFAKSQKDHQDASTSHYAAAMEHTLAAGRQGVNQSQAKAHREAANAHMAAATAHTQAAVMKAPKQPTGNFSSLTDAEVFAVYNREWPQAKRDALDPEDFAGPERSFPVKTQEDLDAAVRSIGRSKHDPETIRAGITRIAKRKGLSLPDAWTGNASEEAEECADEAEDAEDLEECLEENCDMGIARNTWSDEARAASAESRRAKHSDAMSASEKARSASDRPEAAGLHQAAAEAHRDAAAAYSKAKMKDPAKFHKERENWHAEAAMRLNEGTRNQTFGNYREGQMWNAEREASKSAAGASMATDAGGDDHQHTMAALSHAQNDDPKSAAIAHRNAAKFHEASAVSRLKDGDQPGADKHHAAAAAHRKAAAMHEATRNRDRTTNQEQGRGREANTMKRTAKPPADGRHVTANLAAMSDEELVDRLVENCDCEGDRAMFARMSRRALLSLNEKAQGSNADVSESTGSDQAGGEEDWDDEDEGEKDDQGAGKKGQRFESDPGEGVDYHKVGEKSEGAMTGNAATAAYLRAAPPDVRRILTNAFRVEQKEKRAVVGRLTANLGNKAQREAATKHLMRKDIDELRMLASLIPTENHYGPAANGRYEPDVLEDPVVALFAGAAGGPPPVSNRGEEDQDVLETQTLNYREMGRLDESPEWRRVMGDGGRPSREESNGRAKVSAG
jgi:hypothetical protein